MNNKEIHIYQLPEKTNNVNKLNTYTLIHDNHALKKVNLNLLYEFFNQDYKIENIVTYFEGKLDKYNKEYELLYESFEGSLEIFNGLIETLNQKFQLNSANLRSCINRSASIDNSIKVIETSFNDIMVKFQKLQLQLEDLSVRIYGIKTLIDKNNNSLNDIKSDHNEMVENISQLYLNYGSIKDQINHLKEISDQDIKEKKETLIQNIHKAYDDIVTIIRYYHHENKN